MTNYILEQRKIAEAIAKENYRLMVKGKWRDYMKSIKYGHDFNTYNNRCTCGMSVRDYIAVSPWEDQEVCPNIKGTHVRNT